MEKRELLPPSDDTASRVLIDVQTATTRVKTIISECVSKGISDDELTQRLNKAIAAECKRIQDAPFREQFRKALINSARKWHWQLTQTYRINEQNLASAVKKQPLNIELKDLLGKTPFQKQFDIRRILDDGKNPGIPIIRDYQKGIKLAIKAMSAEPPKIVTPKNGKVYTMAARLRAEVMVRYSAAMDSLQRLIDDGVNWCWISSHPNCSERCKGFQGKLYSLFDKPKEIDGKNYTPSGTVDGIPYEYIGKALAGSMDDGNGCISGYNCRHRAIEYERGSRPPADYTDAEIKKAYAIDKQQRSYENRIRQMKQEEALLRANGAFKEASEVRKKWRIATKEYQIYSIQNDRAYYPYRYIVDREELEKVDREEEDRTEEKTENTLTTNTGFATIEEPKREIGFRTFDDGNAVNEFFGGKTPAEKENSAEYRWLQQLTEPEKQSISGYTSSIYEDLNDYLRAAYDPSDTRNYELDTIARDLDESIKKFELLESITVFRGTDIKEMKVNFPEVNDLKDLIGLKYIDKGFVSSSLLSEVAIYFAKKNEEAILFQFDITSGQGRGAYINSLSTFRDEEFEFLIKRDSAFEIYEVQEDQEAEITIVKARMVEK